MSALDFEYEIAFSFCARDEAIATELDDLLRDRFKTFVYSRKQEVVAGTDGEETFADVFLEKTRVAVILYRAEWGETPFTRIERSAIRKRAFAEGYGFTVWIAMEGGVKMPPYVEPTRIYYALGKYGLEGAAAVIYARIQERGGNTRPETLAERAARLQRRTEAHEARLRFLASAQGIASARSNAMDLLNAIATSVRKLEGWEFGLDQFIDPTKVDSWIVVRAKHVALLVQWHQPYNNTLEGMELTATVWGGNPPLPGRTNYYISGSAPPQRRREQFEFERTVAEEDAWRRTSGKPHIYSQPQLVEHCISMLLEEAEREVRERRAH